MKKLVTMTLTMATMLAFTTTSSHAADKKSYHAANCQAIDGKNEDYSRSLYRVTRTGSSSNGTLVCPIVRDVFTCSGWGGCVLGSTVKVAVQDNHYTEDVTCAASSRTVNGSIYVYNTKKTNAAPSTVEILEISAGYPPGDGTLVLTCSLPTNNSQGWTRFFSYMVEERD